MKYILIAVIFLSGCSALMNRAEDLSHDAIKTRVAFSEKVVGVCMRAICDSVSIKAKRRVFNTDKKRAAYDIVCPENKDD